MNTKVKTKSQKTLFDLACIIMANDAYNGSDLLINVVHSLFCLSEGNLVDARSDIAYIARILNK